MSIAPLFAIVIVIYHLVVVGNLLAYFGIFIPSQVHAAISLTSACLIIFLTVRARATGHGGSAGADQDHDAIKVAGSNRIPLYDWLFILAAMAANGYVVFFHENIESYAMFGLLDTPGIVLAFVLSVVVLEAVRRTSGIALPLVILFFVGITIFQRYLPGILYGVGYGPSRILYAAYVGDAGIFGQPLQIATTVIFVFLLFGATMQAIGVGQWVIDLAMVLTCRSRGGPAKAAVVASALFGSISGSPSSNVATTGVFTIPLMKAAGYSGAFAGATEAVAATGGQILPPVMGAIAFVMADWIGVSYAEVVLAATLPAILYYVVLYASVHFQAHKLRLRVISSDQLPKVGPIFRKGWRFLIPIGVLLYFLFVVSYPPQIAGIYATIAVVLCSYLTSDRKQWITLRKLALAAEQTVLRWVALVAITAAVGLMVGSLELSGVGIKLSSFLVQISQGDLILTMVLVGMASLLIGMGLDAIPSYLTLATLMAPALIQLGVPKIAAHLFVIYWGLSSFFTPPMCLAVYVSLPISGARMWETGWQALRLGIAAFLVPFAFVMEPGLLMQGSLAEIVWAFGTALLGAVGLGAAIQGYALSSLGPISRIALGASALLLIAPGAMLPALGFSIAAAVVLGNYFFGRGRAIVPST